jgi:putative oxidoreductase
MLHNMLDVSYERSLQILSILRVIIALLFMEHGTEKLLGFPVAAHPGPAPLSLLGIQGMFELAGGFFLLIGLFTRPVAFILAGDMAVAYAIVHAPRGFFPVLNGGDAAVLFCFSFLYLAAVGGGVWGLDPIQRFGKSG